MRDENFAATQRTSNNKIRTRARERETWVLEPHVCRVCFARVVSRPTEDGDGRRIYQCTTCGTQAMGAKASCICACGMTMRKGGKSGSSGALVDMGVRCHRNQAVSPELPAQYVASYGGIQVEEA